ncbi:DUF2922 domain-containing protein [Metabacillus sp. RGM 3146]|uniref:DUF2922 domain-containing protein n=1 Tax=Metabacillus sp. RGM 3146 TaxID=3401092 RepID=UPI003B99CADD
MAKSLELQFINLEGKSTNIGVDAPKENLTAGEISLAMDKIIAANIFTSGGGDLVSKKGARIVDRTVTDLEIK